MRLIDHDAITTAPIIPAAGSIHTELPDREGLGFNLRAEHRV